MVESVAAPAAHGESQVRQVVEAYYAAFNAHSIDRMKTIVTEDWVHINPLGGWTRGREAVVTELRTVHSTFLKDATDTPEEIVVSFATRDVAIVTVPSTLSTITLPDGARLEQPRLIRTFVVVHQNGNWRIMQDQNTLRRV